MHASNVFWIQIILYGEKFVCEIHILMQVCTMFVVIKYTQYKSEHKIYNTSDYVQLILFPQFFVNNYVLTLKIMQNIQNKLCRPALIEC